MGKIIRIGTRESPLAIWQAQQVHILLSAAGFESELVPVKSGGDIDLVTPLYEMGVQGIFTKELDIALLKNNIDIAVHSMKDVPTQLAEGIHQVAVLTRGPYDDLVVFKNTDQHVKYLSFSEGNDFEFTIATSSLRRKAQWLHQYPSHRIENLRGSVNTRLRKLQEENWNAAIFARAGLERIDLRPTNSMVLDWMLPAPAQGAIVVLAQQTDHFTQNACSFFNDPNTALCTKIERDFLRALLGGCSAPISALAKIINNSIHFKGNILSVDGKEKQSIELQFALSDTNEAGEKAAKQLLSMGGQQIIDKIRNGGKYY